MSAHVDDALVSPFANFLVARFTRGFAHGTNGKYSAGALVGAVERIRWQSQARAGLASPSGRRVPR